jgi:hypothetical protein
MTSSHPTAFCDRASAIRGQVRRVGDHAEAIAGLGECYPPPRGSCASPRPNAQLRNQTEEALLDAASGASQRAQCSQPQLLFCS